MTTAPLREGGHLAAWLAATFVALALDAGSAAWAASAPPNDATRIVRRFDMPAGPLAVALQNFAGAAGVAVTAPDALTQGKTAPMLSGRYTVDAGFAALLAGSGLEAVPSEPGKYVVQRVAAPAREAGPEAAILPKVEVTAQAFSDSTVTVTARQIAETAPRDTRETLQDETGVAVGGGGNAIAQKIYVREIEDTMLNVTLDGVPQGGNVFHHQGRVLIDPMMMKRIEIDKGGTLASIGPGGLAGSVRMTTKDARDLLLAGRAFGALALGGAESNDGWEAGGAVYGLAADSALDFVAYLKRRDTADYEAGNGQVQSNTGSTQVSGLFKTGLQIAPLHRLSFRYLGLEDEGVRYPRPHMVGFPGSNVPMPQTLDQSTWTAGYRYDGEGKLPSLDLVAFFDDVENKRTNGGSVPVFGKPPGYTFGERLETAGANLLLRSLIGSTPLRYGLNYQDREASAINPTRTGYQGNTSKETTDVTGIFAETGIPFGGAWTLELGARYDWYRYDDNHGQSYTSNGLSPNANLTLQVTRPLAVWVGVSSTLRGVGPKEIFMLDNGPGPLIYRNAPDLDPERADNYELGVAYDDGTWSLKGSIFRMEISDYLSLVYRDGPPATATRENAGKVTSNGFELAAGYRKGPLRVDLSVADARPKLNGYDLGDGDFSLGTTIGVTWLAAVRYEIPQWNLVAGWNGRFVQEVEYTPAGASTPARKAGYGVNDIYLSWLPQRDDSLRIGIGVRNLFDQFYFDQATYGFSTDRGMFLGYPDPGRNVWVNLAWRF
ncbi:MAG: TonB-dependent receptor [Burkholderiales bacterium]|nr:TonB-dependent receptor [Burkholderiales bacterium]